MKGLNWEKIYDLFKIFRLKGIFSPRNDDRGRNGFRDATVFGVESAQTMSVTPP